MSKRPVLDRKLDSKTSRDFYYFSTCKESLSPLFTGLKIPRDYVFTKS